MLLKKNLSYPVIFSEHIPIGRNGISDLLLVKTEKIEYQLARYDSRTKIWWCEGDTIDPEFFLIPDLESDQS